MLNVYKFVTDGDFQPVDSYIHSTAHQLMTALNNGVSHKDIPSDLIEKVLSQLWHSETYRNGTYRLMGYAFDFSPFLKSYLVKTKYEGWQEYKAFNKTMLRKFAVIPSQILQIVELKD